MVQYHEIKRANPGCLLFFRMGDFYELFFEDAVAAARALDIALTKRGRHEGADIPMCGVPVHTAEAYLARLIRAGFKVAMCDQIEDPAEAKRRGAKMLRRAVVRVVTAGTLTEEGLLDARRHNYLTALAEAGGEMGLAWLDLSTGAFQLAPTSELALASDLARLAPGEIVLPERLLARPALFELFAEWKPALTPLPNPRFESDAGRRRLQEFYGVGALDGFGNFGRAELAAAGALVDYVSLTQQGRAPHLEPPRRMTPGSVMQIDAATRRNLELVTTLAGERKGSLLATIDRTVTAAGARLLAEHLAAPLTEPAAIAARLDAVEFYVDRPEARAALRERLRHCPDIERALTRLSLGRGGPRDLAALRQSLGETASLRQMLAEPGLVPLPQRLAEARRGLGEHGALVERLGRALAAELPLFARDGGFIAAGYSDELDEWQEPARREPPDDRGTAGALRRRDRDRRLEDPPQQRDRLLHRGVGQPCRQARAGVHPPPDDGRGAALYDGRARRARNQDRQCGRAGLGARIAALGGSRRRGHGAPRRDRRRRGGTRRPRSRRGPRRARGRGGLGAAGGRGRDRLRDPRAGVIRRSRRHSPLRATAAGSSPTTASWRRTGSGSSPAPTWPARAPFCGRTR